MKNSEQNKLKTRWGIYPFVFLLVFLAGCSAIQIGNDFEVGLFSRMVKAGSTTKSQVQGWLGKPRSTGVSVDKDGDVTDEWMYFYGTGTLPKMQDTRLKILQVRFNKSGIVTSYNWSSDK